MQLVERRPLPLRFRAGSLVPIVVLLAVLLVLVAVRQPGFLSPPSLLSFASLTSFMSYHPP